MTFVIVGLGNPGPEYEHTRHNTGRIVLEAFRKANDLPEWAFDEKLNARISRGSVPPLSSKVKSSASAKASADRRQSVVLVQPQTFMNKSGDSLRENKDLRFKIYDKKKKEISNLVVIHDDLDIPFGKYKISFNKSSGGHKGVESIIRALKTRGFVRVRVGIASSAAATRKPQDDGAVEKTILGKYTPDQLTELKKLAKRIAEGLTVLITEGREKTMSQYNS